MKRSTKRILTSHVGSLPRPGDLLEMIRHKVNGQPYDTKAFAERVQNAVCEKVQEQACAGIDIVNDGEMSKHAFCDYIADRISGFEGENKDPHRFVNYTRRPEPFPSYAAWRDAQGMQAGMTVMERRPACIARLAWRDCAYEQDIENLRHALGWVEVTDAFLPSPSPGIIAMRIPNLYYSSEEEYLHALAEVLKQEYEAIAAAGFVLQIDAPDCAMAWDRQHWLDLGEFRLALEMRIEALNHALSGVPEEQVRLHVCWGNNESPHTGDVPLIDIVDIILKMKATAYSLEAANPRHAHEWKVWETVKLPDGKMLMPGVIDSMTNFVEHPELVSQRVQQYARLVGKENVIAGVDCGFSTGATANPRVHPEVVLAKLRSLSQGAALASRELW